MTERNAKWEQKEGDWILREVRNFIHDVRLASFSPQAHCWLDTGVQCSGVVSKEWPHVRECNHVTMLIEGVKLLLSIRCILVPCSLCPYTEDSRWLSDKHSVPHTSHFWSRVACWDKWRNKETLTAKPHTGAVFIFVILLYSCFFYVFESIFYFTSFK